jgi:hypothetical protein
MACAMLVRQILDASRFRARELETLTDRLWESEARLRDNTLSTQRIVRQSLQDMRLEIDALQGAGHGSDQRLIKLREQIDDLEERVVPESVTMVVGERS